MYRRGLDGTPEFGALKCQLLEVQQQGWPHLLAWLSGVTLYDAVWRRLGCPNGSLHAFAKRVVGELVA